MENHNEGSLLLGDNSPRASKTSLDIFFSFVKGIANSSLVSQTAIIQYAKPNMLVSIPIATSAVITVMNKVLETYDKKNPHNSCVENSKKTFNALDTGAVQFACELGFSWRIVQFAAEIAGVKLDNNFGNFIAPGIASIPAVLSTTLKYKEQNNIPIENTYAKACLKLISAGIAPASILFALAQQNILTNPKFILITLAASATVGLASALTPKNHSVTKFLDALVTVVTTSAQLANVFSVANDIYAANNKEELPVAFFVSNLILSASLAVGWSVKKVKESSTQVKNSMFTVQNDNLQEVISPSHTDDKTSSDDDSSPDGDDQSSCNIF